MSTIQEAYLQNVQANYRFYCFHANNPKNEKGEVDVDNAAWYPGTFHRYLCDTVQEFVNARPERAFSILGISTPPQFGKSLTLTETLASWYVMRNPDKRCILISYGDDLADRFGSKNLEKVEELGGLFGVSLDKKKKNSHEFRIAKHKGYVISRGFGSPLTGFSGDLIIIDDPIKNRQEADSETKRNAIWNEFIATVTTRAQFDAKVIIIQTRWHEDDLLGRVIETYKDRCRYINIPCECEEENDVLGRKIGDSIGWDNPKLGKGNEWLKDLKSGLLSSESGTRTWNALYQGRPSAREGNLLKREWWQYYEKKDYEEGRLKIDKVIMSVDAAFKDKDKNDYVAIQVWGKVGARCYLLESVNEHLNFPNTVKKIRMLKARYPNTRAIYIEDKANGTAVIQTLKDQIMGIIPVEPQGGKEARVEAISAYVEAGNIYLPKDKNFSFDFVEQCASFPNAKHDDIVDAMSQGLTRLIRMRGFREEYKRMKSDWNINRKKTGGFGKGEEIVVI